MTTSAQTKKQPMFDRSSGILMHISSLPGPYGIGTFGKPAKDFVDFLVKTGCAHWQVLPFGPIDAFNSPYQSLSAFAGNPFFIDPKGLYDAGLLTEEELKSAEYDGSPWATAYDFLRETRIDLFKKAFARVDDTLLDEMTAFAKDHPWLDDYTLYQAIVQMTGESSWLKWDKPLKDRHAKALDAVRHSEKETIDFETFLQYCFFTQWEDVKAYANKNGIGIIGDMPIYVSIDSPDVWANRDLFDLTKDGHPKNVAGVPPDYFSEDGQLWGNPLYDWAAMKKDGYAWWLDRLDMALTLFDTVRIDHFRAFSAFWSVPASEKTAKGGKWIDGPGMDLFNRVEERFDFSQPRIIAEDLGVQDDGVKTLLADSGFPGLRVMQFAFIDPGDGMHWPHNYLPNTVAYTGTHDNNTLLGYLWELNEGAREFAFQYIHYDGKGDAWQQGGPHSPVCHAFIRHLWLSSAKLVIIPMQDLLGYGADAKMNFPGRAEGNWTFRLPQEAIDSADADWLFEMNRIYKRLPAPKPQDTAESED